MSDTNSGGNPKREILVDARNEIRLASRFLKDKKDVDSQYAKMHLEMANKLVNGVITALEAPQQTYNLD
jgi:hypothetical protein